MKHTKRNELCSFRIRMSANRVFRCTQSINQGRCLTKYVVTKKSENTELISILYFEFPERYQGRQYLKSIVQCNILKFVYLALDLSRCLAILQVSFLLREDQFSIFKSSIQPRIKCKNILLEKSFSLLQKWTTFILSQWKMLQLKQMIFFKRFCYCWRHLTFLTQSSRNNYRQHFYLFIQDMSELPNKV